MSGEPPNELVDRAYSVGNFATAAAAPAGDQRGTIRALGIIQIVLGGVCSLLALGSLLGGVVSSQGGMMAAGVVYALPATNLLLTGIGSLRISPWARPATMISAGIWLGIVLLAIAVVLAIVFSLRSFAVDRDEKAILGVVMVPILLVWIGLPVVLITVYRRPAVRATFERR